MRFPIRWIELTGAMVLPLMTLIFIVGDHARLWDRLLGLDRVEMIAARFDTSYADVDRQIGPDEPGWEPLLRLIYRYSLAELPRDRVPKVVARAKAVSSAKIPTGKDSFAEWTAPSTPIILMYRRWPGRPGQTVPPNDYRLVGTIGDLHSWIERRRTDLRFLFQDIFVSLVSIAVALVLWLRASDSQSRQ